MRSIRAVWRWRLVRLVIAALGLVVAVSLRAGVLVVLLEGAREALLAVAVAVEQEELAAAAEEEVAAEAEAAVVDASMMETPRDDDVTTMEYPCDWLNFFMI